MSNRLSRYDTRPPTPPPLSDAHSTSRSIIAVVPSGLARTAAATCGNCIRFGLSASDLSGVVRTFSPLCVLPPTVNSPTSNRCAPSGSPGCGFGATTFSPASVRSPLPLRSTYRASPSRTSHTRCFASPPNTSRPYRGGPAYFGSLETARSIDFRSAAASGAARRRQQAR